MLRSASFWLLSGLVLGLLLLVGSWSSLRAESEEVRREIRLAQAEYDELEPFYREVRELKARKESLESLLADVGLRSRLVEVSQAVVTASELDLFVERLDVSGSAVGIVGRAEDPQALRRFNESLRGNEICSAVDPSVAETSTPSRFEVRCRWHSPEPGGDR